jgi:hypothetical protein
MKRSPATAFTHTCRLPDGRLIDVLRLQEILESAPVEFIPLGEIRGASRRRRSGFSQKRYARANPNVAGIVDSTKSLLDGRHRYLKREDSGCRYMPVRFATAAHIEACVIE